MKQNNARKITALLLALMMILPVISIPAVAEPTVVTPGATGVAAPNTLYAQNFDELALGTTSVVKGPSTARIVAGPEGRGNVLQIDCKPVGDPNTFYVCFNKGRDTFTTISDATVSTTILPDGSAVPYVEGTIKPLSNGVAYRVAGPVNTNSCAIEIDTITDMDGNPVKYADIIVKGYLEINEVDEKGEVIWVPVLDENGNQVIGEQVDANGKVIMVPVYLQETNEDGTPKFDEDGNPVYVQAKDANGNLKFDKQGNPVWVEKTEPVLDDQGNVIMDPVIDPVLGIPMFETNPDGSLKFDENGNLIYVTAPRMKVVTTPKIGPVSKTIKRKINDTSKFVATSLHITTEEFKDVYNGTVNNVGKYAYAQHPAFTSDILVFSADYFFSAAVEDDPETPDVDESVEALTRGMDIRVAATYQYEEDGVIKTQKKNFDFMSLGHPSNGKITLKAHENDAKTALIPGTKTVDLGTWVNILIAADLRSGTCVIYVDGELMCVRQDADLSSPNGPATGHWVGPCASVNANSWNIGHFLRGGNVSDYHGFAQIDNLAVYDGSKMADLFAYLGYSKEFEEDYEDKEIGTILDTYFDGSLPISAVVDFEGNGNKSAMIDLTHSGNIGANFKPKTGSVTYLDSKTVVLESDYYLTSDAVSKIQSQIQAIGAHIDVLGSPFAYPMQSDKSYTEINLYTIDASNPSSDPIVTFAGATVSEETGLAPSVTIERGRWNTFSTVINLSNGSYTLYINGVAAISGRLAKIISGTEYYFNDISFTKNQWVAAKVMTGSLNRQGKLYLDEMMVTELGGGKAETVLVEAMLSADIYANGQFYTTVTDSNVFYKSSDIEIDAKVFDLKEQVGTSQLLAMEGASIRFTSPTGLRFASKVDLDALNALYAMVDNPESEISLKSVSFGTLIIPTDMLDGVDLSFENLNAKGITDYLDIPGIKDYYYDLDGDETTTHICGSILDIKEKNIDRLFTGVNYVRIVLPNGIEYNIYSRTHRASAQSVADDAWGEYTPAEQAVIDAFLAGVKPAADIPVVPPVEDGGNE